MIIKKLDMKEIKFKKHTISTFTSNLSGYFYSIQLINQTITMVKGNINIQNKILVYKIRVIFSLPISFK